VSGVMLWFCTGALISNNQIHSIQPPDARPAGTGIQSFRSHSNVYEFNTIYDCGQGIYDKNNTNGNHTFRYNYIECAGLNPGSVLLDCSGGNPGDTLTVHNNVLVGPTIFAGTDALIVPSPQSLLFYNNTCVFGGPQKADRGIVYPAGGHTIAPAAMVRFYNNIVQCTGQVGYAGLVSLCAGTVALSDFNVLSAVDSSELMSLTPVTEPRAIPKLYSLADWRSLTGMDRHSTTSAATFASAMDRTPTGFQLQAGSAYATAGRVGGVVSGAPTALGAWGGGATQIGCNFGPAPKAVSLSVS
jgi:Right handed beta helix region